MSIFTTEKNIQKNTTEGFFFGLPEAEAEKTFERRNNVSFYEDYFNILNEIGNGKFIISGRKGSGKSAIAKHILEIKKDHELYAIVVNHGDYVINKSINAPDNTVVSSEILWEWLTLVKFVKMILDSQIAQYLQEIKSLKLFWKNNSGFLDIEKFDVKEIITNNSHELSFNPLKNILSAAIKKGLGVKAEHAPFYKLIPALREIVSKVLRMDVFKSIDFVVMYDDLDIDFNLNDKDDQQNLLNLIRMARNYNTSRLDGTGGKVLLFIRDDVSSALQAIGADTGKLFGSYECQIKWYNHEIGNDDDNNNPIKRFVNRRLSINFNLLGIKYNRDNPWESFVEENYYGYSNKSAFKYLLDYTFYRPRDIINIFKDVGKRKYKLPMSCENVKSLIKNYLNDNKIEVFNELSVLYDKQKQGFIETILGSLAKNGPLEYNKVIQLFQQNSLSEKDLKVLIDYYVVIPMEDNHPKFSYREGMIDDELSAYKYGLPLSILSYYTSSLK